jgi:DNA topoisomerase VI subunit A
LKYKDEERKKMLQYAVQRLSDKQSQSRYGDERWREMVSYAQKVCEQVEEQSLAKSFGDLLSQKK